MSSDINALISQLFAYSMPINLQAPQLNIDWKSRRQNYLERHEMYKDTFTREMVKIIIGRALGTSINDNTPFQIKIIKEFPNKIKEQLKEDLKDLEKLINKNLMEVLLDSQFYGDGYVKKVYNKGIVDLLCNFSTKAPNITPIVTNFGRTLAYEVAINGLKDTKMGKAYVAPIDVARLNAKKNGVEEPTQEQFIQIKNINVFADQEMPYESSVYGGVVEGCYNDFVKFKWAIKALANTRIASSMLERFITHNLGDIAKDEQKLLKKALETSIKKTLDTLKDRQATANPDILIANHIIPTTGDNTVNSVSIQESDTNFNGFQSIEDIMLHIKSYLGAIGFNIEYTPYGTGQGVGMSKDDPAQNSLQMEEQATQIRQATAEYIKDITISHIASKYNLQLNDNDIDILFTSVFNHARLTAEQQRMESITNSQQVLSIIDQLKGQGYTEEDKPLLRDLVEDCLPQDVEDREDKKELLINLILRKPVEEEQQNV